MTRALVPAGRGLPVLVLLGALVTAALPVRADDPDFWEAARTPELPHYRRELRAGLQLLDASDVDIDVDEERRAVLLRGAAVHFERAAAMLPDRVEAHYFLGSVRFSLRDDDGAIESFRRVRALEPDSVFEAEIAFKLGVGYTRQRRFAQAVIEYDRALALALDERRGSSLSLRSVALSNRAEVQMGLDHLEEAIASYELSYEADDRNAGALWGLAVALDRHGQILPSREAAARAVSMDPERQGIVAPDVFFVPPHERHYYLGIAFEAAGERELALAEWQTFLLAAGSDGRWAGQATRHVQELRPTPRARHPRRRP